MAQWVSSVPWATVVLYTLALLGSVSGLLAWIAKLRWSVEYRATLDEVVKAKDAQIGVLQESLKPKDVNIENLRMFTYAEADRHLSALKNVYEQPLADTSQQLSDLAAKFEDAATQLSEAREESRLLREIAVEAAGVARRAVDHLSSIDEDYKERVAALNARDDDLAVVLRGNLQAMEEANRIAQRGRDR